MRQLPFSDDEMGFKDWVACELDRRGVAGGMFDWDVTMGSLVASVPRQFLSDTDALINKDLWRRVNNTLKQLGYRRYDATTATLEGPQKARPVGAKQAELPFVQFLDLQASRMRLANADIAAIRHDVEEWALVHPEEISNVDEVMLQIRSLAAS